MNWLVRGDNVVYITVLMTTYNEKIDVLRKAVDSILSQTYNDFSFLIVVDNPNNQEIIDALKCYQEKDKRIKIIINNHNVGLGLSLNRGIELINTDYIARMDADDVAVKDRLEIQLKYLSAHKNIDLIGSEVWTIDDNNNITGYTNSYVLDKNKIHNIMKYVNIFKHPTFFGKTEVFRKIKYRNLKYAQDYDFICRAIEQKYNVYNIKEKLLYYRIQQQINKDKVVLQEITADTIRKYYKKSILTNTDIVSIIDKINTNNKKIVFKAKLDIDMMLQKRKERDYIGFIKYFAKNIFISKYHRRKILNLVKYALIR